MHQQTTIWYQCPCRTLWFHRQKKKLKPLTNWNLAWYLVKHGIEYIKTPISRWHERWMYLVVPGRHSHAYLYSLEKLVIFIIASFFLLSSSLAATHGWVRRVYINSCRNAEAALAPALLSTKGRKPAARGLRAGRRLEEVRAITGALCRKKATPRARPGTTPMRLSPQRYFLEFHGTLLI